MENENKEEMISNKNKNKNGNKKMKRKKRKKMTWMKLLYANLMGSFGKGEWEKRKKKEE